MAVPLSEGPKLNETKENSILSSGTAFTQSSFTQFENILTEMHLFKYLFHIIQS